MNQNVSVLLVVLAITCSCQSPSSQTPTALANGIYEVEAAAADATQLPEADPQTRVLVYDSQFVRGGSEVPPEYVLLRIGGHAPLDLAKAPETTDSGGSPRLLLQLRPDASRALTELTSRAKRAAVVIGGKVVTVHGIKTPIEGGALQVSC